MDGTRRRAAAAGDAMVSDETRAAVAAAMAQPPLPQAPQPRESRATDIIFDDSPAAECGDLYTFDEARPLLGRIAGFAAKRWPQLREDLEQAALLGGWEATKDGPAPSKAIATAAKRAVRDCIAELNDRSEITVANAPETPPPDEGVTDGRAKVPNGLRVWDSLDEYDRRFLRLHFRDGVEMDDAAIATPMPLRRGRWLARQYRKLLSRDES